MGKLKYQGGITRKLCQKQAEWQKAKFRKAVLENDDLIKMDNKTVNFEIISLSGAASFEDQLLSIYSFVYYAGVPIHWTIYSDKSYTEEHKAIFKRKFPFVTIEEWDTYDYYRTNPLLKAYLEECPMAKKANVIIGHPFKHQTVYLDSDILFYKNISYYFNTPLLSKGLWYAPDVMWGQRDVEAYFNKDRDSIYPLNAGLLILNDDFDPSDMYEYLDSLKGRYDWHSEQSSFEFAFRKQGAQILDPRQFINDCSDQFDFSTKFNPADIAMRHYTTPVRHKMWQNGWKWNFTD